ncbi:MAG TPA: TonB family protein [Bryobacteraceae bacterium]|nr:TonB family protein [Bryobacteraceae bacterium]
MFRDARTPLSHSAPRPLPFGFSITVHGVLLGLVALGPPPRGATEARSLYEQVIKPREHDLVWYSFRQKLPEVSPLENQNAEARGAEVKLSDQTIISNQKQSQRGTQMIWRPVPQIKPQPEVPAPNILAFRMPLIAPPPPGPPPKLFVPPAPKPKEAPKPAPALPEPPTLRARIDAKLNPALAVNLAAALENRPKPRSFVPPVPKPMERAAARALPEVPKIQTSLRSDRVPLLAESMAAPLANKPQPRTFMPPAAKERPPAGPVAMPDAPKVTGQLALNHAAGITGLVDNTAAALANKPKPRTFVPPPRGRSGGGEAAAKPTMPAIEDAPAWNAAAMPSANVNVAVVGLNPAAKLSAPLPETSRPAAFSAGPDANGVQGGSAGPPGTALTVPGLLVRNEATAPANATVKNPLLIARAAPTSPEALAAAAREANGAAPSDPPPTEIHLEPPPDPKFMGRDVYTLAVQMPNVSSYQGSWIMWFAERTPAGRARHDLQPPVPIHKVDPKYIPAAIAERIEGKVQLTAVIGVDGRVEDVRVLKSVDPRLDRSAADALLKWEFTPAERHGQPVEVDVVAEIPFLLAPRVRQ